MSKKKPWKTIKKSLGRFTRPIRQMVTVPLLQSMCWLTQRLSHRAVLRLGRWLGALSWLFSPGRRRLAERQLLETGVAGDTRQARRISRQVFASLAMNMLEWLHSLQWDDETYRRHVIFEHPEKMKKIIQSGEGLLLVAGHMGSWELMVRSTRAWFNTPITSLMAETSNYRFNQWLVRQRETSGTKMLPSRAPVISMIRHMKRGGILAMLIDQDSRRNRGDFIQFFGKPAYTPLGPGHLACRTGLPILPVSITRSEEDPTRHVIHLGEIVKADPAATLDDGALQIMQTCTDYLEQRIRLTPGQWVWIHDRWRHRPGQKIKVRSA